MNIAAMTVLVLVMAAAAFFPETFITDFPLIGSSLRFPLTLLLPALVLVTVLVLVRERGTLELRPADAGVIVFSLYILARNLPFSPGLTIKYVSYGICLYYLTAILSRSVPNSRRLFLAVTAILLAVSAYALMEYAYQGNFLFGDYISVGEPQDTTHRVASSLAHPVVFGAFLVQVVPFSIYLWARGWKRSVSAAGMAASILAMICLFLTSSKGSWIVAVLLGIAVTAYFVKTGGKRSLLIALVLLGLVALTAGLFSNRFSIEGTIRAKTSVDVRLTSWETALEGIGDNFIFGVGLKNGEAEVVERIPDWWKELSGFSPPVDNFYLNVFLEEGAIGGVAWLAMMTLIIWGGVSVVRHGGRAGYMPFAAQVSIVGLMINMMTFDALIIWSNMVYFWLAAGFLRGWYSAGSRSFINKT